MQCYDTNTGLGLCGKQPILQGAGDFLQLSCLGCVWRDACRYMLDAVDHVLTLGVQLVLPAM